MNNTAHFGLTSTGTLLTLGVGPNTDEGANDLADLAESIGDATGKPVQIVALLDIADLYRLKGEITEALNNLDNEALGAPVEEVIPTL